MVKISFTEATLAYLQKRGFLTSTLLLTAADAGGKYSVLGGSCSMGMHYSLIKLAAPDKDFSLKLVNSDNVAVYSSQYNLKMLGSNLILDYVNAGLLLKDETGLLDGNLLLADGSELLSESNQETTKNC